MLNKLMANKQGLIMGLANDKSIAWGIARACANSGADLCFSYQGETLKRRVAPLADQLNSDFIVECDVSKNADVENLFKEIKRRWGKLDFLVQGTTKVKIELIEVGDNKYMKHKSGS